MGKNDYTKTILMLLCFGMAFLSLAMYWRARNAMPQMSISSNSNSSQPNSIIRSSFPTKTTQNKTNQNITNQNITPQNQNTQFNWFSQLFRIEQPSQASANPPNPNTQAQTNQPIRTGYNPAKKANQNPAANLSYNPAQQDNRNKTKVIVDLSDRRVYVYRLGQVIASYPTGIGKRGWETPVGAYQIIHMEHDPIWKHPITGKIFPAGQPDSPLGARWIGFHSTEDGEIGFHGTPDERLVGSSASHGCLRMRNGDVKLLYAQVNLGTPVEVRQ